MRMFFTQYDKHNQIESVWHLEHIEYMHRQDETAVLVQYASGIRSLERFTDPETTDAFIGAFLRSCECPLCRRKPLAEGHPGSVKREDTYMEYEIEL